MRPSRPAWLRREGRITIGSLHETEVAGRLDSFVRAIERERGFEVVRGDTWVRFHGPYDRKAWEWEPLVWKVESAHVRFEAGTPGYAHFELSTLDQSVESAVLAAFAEEQDRLRGSRVAIAGMGGVGGFHLLTLARLGVGAFNLADFDTFGLVNFNRQAGAAVSTLGKRKLDVMSVMARDINPELDLRQFPSGLDERVLDDFLSDVDLYVDGLDFFALDIRQAVFAACAKKGIPAITVAPLGMGAALLNFLPGNMTFEAYFGFARNNQLEKAIRFFIGLAPARLHMGYLVDPSKIDLANHKITDIPYVYVNFWPFWVEVATLKE